MPAEELGQSIRELMPSLAEDDRIVALEIYKGLAASGTISVVALGDRIRLERSRVEAIAGDAGQHLGEAIANLVVSSLLRPLRENEPKRHQTDLIKNFRTD